MKVRQLAPVETGDADTENEQTHNESQWRDDEQSRTYRQTDIRTNWLSSTFNTYRAVCYEQCNSLTTANFVTAGTLTLSPERQSARMSKIANDGLSRSSRRRL